jgi:hypothetical protein
VIAELDDHGVSSLDGAMELAKWLLSDPNETLYQIVQGVDVRVVPEFFLGMKGANGEENAVLSDPALVAALSEVYAEDFRFLSAVMGSGRLAVEGASLLGVLSGAGAVRTAVAQAGKTAVKAADDVAGAAVVGAAKGGSSKIDAVIAETFASKGNITSTIKLSADDLLEAGQKFLGSGYKEIGKPGSGVFRSADGTRQFRIDNSSISGNHAPGVSHGHFELYELGATKPTVNNHVPFFD